MARGGACNLVAVGEVELSEEVAVVGNGLETFRGQLITLTHIQRLK